MLKKAELIACEEAALWISRNLEGDLNREETRLLFHHVALCPGCQTHMDEVALLESQLAQWQENLGTQKLGPQFNARLQQALNQLPQAHPSWMARLRLLWQSLPQARLRGLMTTGAMGTMGVLAFVFWLQAQGKLTSPAPTSQTVRTEASYFNPPQAMFNAPSPASPPVIPVNFHANERAAVEPPVRMVSPMPVHFRINPEGVVTLVKPQRLEFVGLRYAHEKAIPVSETMLVVNKTQMPFSEASMHSTAKALEIPR